MLGQATNRELLADEPRRDTDRIRMLAELRTRYLQGTLDEVLVPNDAAIDRLLGDLLTWND